MMQVTVKTLRHYEQKGLLLPDEVDELKRTLEAMDIDYYKPAVKGVRNRILSGKIEKKK